MIKLYGFAVSNYYNMVKFALLEKGIAFEEVTATPSQEAAYTARSPMGKVPCIETPQGCLSETAAILEFLEDSHPEPRLLPADAFERAKVRELMHGVELYIELQARRHFRHVFFGEARSQTAVDEVRPVVENGLRALRQLMGKGPWICGGQFTLADIFAYHTFGYAAMAMNAIYGWDIVAEVPGLKEILARIAERPAAKRVDADQQAALQAFMAQKAAG